VPPNLARRPVVAGNPHLHMSILNPKFDVVNQPTIAARHLVRPHITHYRLHDTGPSAINGIF
jgi:hypothetical protein